MIEEPNIPGFFTKPQFDFLYKVVKEAKPRVAVEIGCWMGRSTYAIAKAMEDLPEKRLICVDSWKQKIGKEYFESEHMNKVFSLFPGSREQYAKDDAKSLMEMFEVTLSRFPFMKEMVDVRNIDSRQVDLSTEQIEFSFIDGDHTYEGTKNDIAKVLQGAKFPLVMAFHDYSETHYPGVVKAIHEMLDYRRGEKLGQAEHTVAFRVS